SISTFSNRMDAASWRIPALTSSQNDVVPFSVFTEIRRVFLEDKYLAARFGRYPRVLTICRTLVLVMGLTPGLSWRARCTEPIETPSAFAMPRRVVEGLRSEERRVGKEGRYRWGSD